jgi:hypothetical protein
MQPLMSNGLISFFNSITHFKKLNDNGNKKNRTFCKRNVRLICPTDLLRSNYFAGAGAGAASGAGTAVAAGAGCATGASTLGAGAVSSAFLQPTTAKVKEATNSIATKIANIFFING